MAIKRILVVDDSPTDRQFLSELLSKSGFSVSTAESAEDAFNKVKQAKPDLALQDVVAIVGRGRPPEGAPHLALVGKARLSQGNPPPPRRTPPGG